MLIGSFVYFDVVVLVILLTFFIPFWIFRLLAWQLFSYSGLRELVGERDLLEFFWTIIPTGTVAFLCYLNLRFLCQEVPPIEGDIIKVIGRQWYWRYDYFSGLSYDSLMLDLLDEVDKPLRARYGVPCSLLIRSSDVIHCFSIPDLGLKVDAIPGRVNQISFLPDRIGVYAGYCAELCGAGHAYMPVILEVVVGSGLK